MWSVNTVWDSETEPIETFNYDISAYMNSTAEAVIKSNLGYFLVLKALLPKYSYQSFQLFHIRM